MSDIDNIRKKKIEELKLHDIIQLAREENRSVEIEEEREAMNKALDLIEKDERYFWDLTNRNVCKIIDLAGFKSIEEWKIIMDNIRTEDKYKEFVERQKKNSVFERLKFKVGSIISPDKYYGDNDTNGRGDR